MPFLIRLADEREIAVGILTVWRGWSRTNNEHFRVAVREFSNPHILKTLPYRLGDPPHICLSVQAVGRLSALSNQVQGVRGMRSPLELAQGFEP